MGNEELMDLLYKTYTDTLSGVETMADLIKAKAQIEVVDFIKMQLTKPKKRSK